MTPAKAKPWDTTQAHGIAYEITASGKLKELWRTSGWYSFQVFLSHDGRHLVRMGPWSVGSEPAHDDLAVAFYQDGKLLKSYSTAELVKDHSKVQRSVSHYTWLADSDSRAADATLHELKLGWDNVFTLSTIDGINYRFNATTGGIESVDAPTNDGWATGTDIDRLCIAVSLAKCPFPYAQLGQLIGLPVQTEQKTKTVSDAGVSLIVFLTKNEKSAGRYALEVDVKTPSSTVGQAGPPLAGEVTRLQLVYFTPERRRLSFHPEGDFARLIKHLDEQDRTEGDTPRTLSEKAIRLLGGHSPFNL